MFLSRKMLFVYKVKYNIFMIPFTFIFLIDIIDHSCSFFNKEGERDVIKGYWKKLPI